MFNYEQEKKEWLKRKTEEEKILRECHIKESIIQELYNYDWEIFKEERRYRKRQYSKDTSFFDYQSRCVQKRTENVGDFLNGIEDERLYICLSEDKVLLNAFYLKTCGYSYKEAAQLLHVQNRAIYNRIGKLKKKLK